jgi:predicted NAD/FAD-binding protein
VVASETVIDRLAREMIERHGTHAALRAVERLNDRIDKADWDGRQLWAAVVHAIHELQHTELLPSVRSPLHPPAHQ